MPSNISGEKDTSILSTILSKTTDIIEIRKGMSVLDLGCATGKMLQLLKKYKCKLYGVDISKKNILIAKNKINGSFYVLDINSGLNRFKSNSLDVLFALDVIEHLKSPYSFLEECFRVLKKDGYMILTTPNLSSLTLFLLALIHKKSQWFGFQDASHLYLFSPLSLSFTISKIKFEIVYKTTFSVILGKTLFLPLNLGGSLFLILKKQIN